MTGWLIMQPSSSALAPQDHRAALPPRTVITADHGEAFGECGIFGHPPGLLLPELIEVPYLTIE